MNMMMAVLLAAGCGSALTALIVWLLAARKQQAVQADNAALTARYEALQQQKNEWQQQAEQGRQQLAQVQQQLSDLHSENTRLATRQQERDASHTQQLQQFEQQKQALQKEFENLANRIFDEKGRAFNQSSQQSLDHLLKPFREQIESFQKRVNDVHSESLRGHATLEAEIKKVLETGLNMQKEADNLARALKGDSQKRGAWGQAQLERTLEMSGLVRDVHYATEAVFRNDENRPLRPDYVVKLPDGKHMVIDSKVTLNAYDELIAAETEEQQQQALDEHIQAVRRHIDDLSSKDYSNLIGMRSPGFVLMFMPVEPAYIEALKHQKDLFGYGYAKNVILVSHTTLVPILRTVANLWMLDQSNKEAREISDRAGEIFNQVCLVAERLQKLGNSLGAVSNHYNDTVKALTGQQGLYGKVDRFSILSSKVSKSLPPLEATHLDLQIERLNPALPEKDRENPDESA